MNHVVLIVLTDVLQSLHKARWVHFKAGFHAGNFEFRRINKIYHEQKGYFGFGKIIHIL